MSRSFPFFPVACFLVVVSAGVVASCSQRASETAPLTLELASPDFTSGGTIPKPLTCDGGDSSPALQWKTPPTGTQSFVLIADDPDAPVGTFVHWIVYDLPPALRSLPQNFPKERAIARWFSPGQK